MTTRRQQSNLDFLSQLQSCLTKVEFGEILPLYIATLQILCHRDSSLMISLNAENFEKKVLTSNDFEV